MLHPLSIHQSIFHPSSTHSLFVFLSSFIHSPLLKYLYILFYVYKCFVWMSGCVPHTWLVLMEFRGGASDTLELELWMFVSHHIGAGNWVLLLCRHKCWVISPAPLPSLSVSPHLPLSTYLVPSVHSTSPFYAAIYPPMPFPSVHLYTRLVHKVNPQHPGTDLAHSENGVANKANLDILWLKACAIW